MSVYDELEALEREVAINKAEKEEIVRQEHELRNRSAQAGRTEEALRQKRLELMRRKREEEAAEAEALRKSQLETLNKIKAEELLNQSKHYDEITAGARWRDRAMDHQIDGSKFLATAKRAICADGMGVGKTLQSLMFLDMVQSKRALIVCQGDVMSNFVDEMKRFTDRPIGIIGKVAKATAQIIIDNYSKALDNFVLVINYESWYRNRAILDSLSDVLFDTVIVDEAHNIKETDKAPYQGVEKVVFAENRCPECRRGAIKVHPRTHYITCNLCGWSSNNAIHTYHPSDARRSVDNLLLMSGTPILNRPEEIYPLLHLINDKLFPYKSIFIRDFCTTDYDGKVIWQPGGEKMLAEKISGFYLRRTHDSAGIILPPQGVTVHEIEFDADLYPLQAKIMKMLRQDAQVQIAEGRTVTLPDLLSLITRERQAATWPGGIKLWEQATETEIDPVTGEERIVKLWDYTNPYKNGDPRPVKVWIPVGEMYRESQKIDRAVELIKQLNDDGRRVVVFSQFKDALEELNARLGDRSVRFDGDTSNSTREAVKRNFNREYNEVPVWDNVLCNYKTGGVGLNLTAATAVVVLDYEWNQSKLDQAYARINRIGQTENTQVHILKLMGTIDEWMDKLIENKTQVTGAFTEAMVESDQFKNDFARELKSILEGGL